MPRSTDKLFLTVDASEAIAILGSLRQISVLLAGQLETPAEKAAHERMAKADPHFARIALDPAGLTSLADRIERECKAQLKAEPRQ